MTPFLAVVMAMSLLMCFSSLGASFACLVFDRDRAAAIYGVVAATLFATVFAVCLLAYLLVGGR